MVMGPAIGMIACSILGLLYCFGWAMLAFVSNGANQPKEISWHGLYYAMVAAFGVSAVIYAAMLFGSVQMIRRRSYGWAVAASILAVAPCNVFTVLSVVFGIWGILVLRKAHVKAAFRQTRA